MVECKIKERKVNLPLFIAKRIARSTEENRPGVMVRIATIAVALSLVVMLISMAVIMGFKQEVSRKLVGFAAHVEFTDVRSRPGGIPHPITRSTRTEDLIRSCAEVKSLTPYASRTGLVKSPEGIQGVSLKGVEGDYDTAFFEELVVEGSLPRIGDSVRSKEILLSRNVARKLRLKVGEKVELLFLEEDGTPRRDRFKISGLFFSGMEEIDNHLALTDLRNVQRLLGWEQNQISGYEIRLAPTARSVEEADAVADQLNREVLYSAEPEALNLVANSIRHRYPTLFDWLKTHDVNAAVILCIMLIVALFNMISVLLILVLERTRMIGLLKALGMTDRALQHLFLYRSAFIIGRGMLWGNLIAWTLCQVQLRTGLWKLDASGYLLSEVPVALDWGWWLGVNGATALLLLLLLALPTYIISYIRPDETIRYE